MTLPKGKKPQGVSDINRIVHWPRVWRFPWQDISRWLFKHFVTDVGGYKFVVLGGVLQAQNRISEEYFILDYGLN